MNAIFPGEMKAEAAALMLLQYEQALAFVMELPSWWVHTSQKKYKTGHVLMIMSLIFFSGPNFAAILPLSRYP